jgi:hypothetical protein
MARAFLLVLGRDFPKHYGTFKVPKDYQFQVNE